MGELRHLLVDARPIDHPTARNRGIGRYTLGLLSGLQQVEAPLVALYETATEADLLDEAIPGLALRQWSPAAVREFAREGTWYLATQLMLHPIPLDPVPRIITDAGLPVAAVMYDVIPERYPELYQQRATARAQVQLRGMLSRTLDALLAISEFAADTAAAELRFPRDRIAMIGAGVDRQFVPRSSDPWPRLARVLTRDERDLVVMVAGTDTRKNTEGVLRAWGLVPNELRVTHRLVVVAAVDGVQLAQWQQWADEFGVARDVTFTGGVTDEEMVALHQAASLAVMPSIEEGFGLPVLEAAACGCVVIASNVSSLPEVLAYPAAEFDPHDATSMSAAIVRALTDAPHRIELRAAAARAVDRWTWANAARLTVDALSTMGPRRRREIAPPPWRVALQGRFDDSAAGVANTAFADAIRSLPHAPEVHLLVEHGPAGSPTDAGDGRFPARAFGRFVHTSLFDRVITLSDDSDRGALLQSLSAR